MQWKKALWQTIWPKIFSRTPYFLCLFVFQLICLFLSSLVICHNVLYHHHQCQNLHCCAQRWMWVMWLSPGSKETVYCPASVCLISASVSLYLWRWNIRIKTPTAVCSTIPSETRPDIWTSVNSVRHMQVGQRWGVLMNIVNKHTNHNLFILSDLHLGVLISAAAAAGSLLTVAAVEIFWICRKHRKTDGQGKCFPPTYWYIKII